MMKEATLFLLSFTVVLSFFFASYFIFSGNIKTQDQNTLLLIGTAYGAVSSLAGQVCSYWFGTSKTSSDKDKVIASQQTLGG